MKELIQQKMWVHTRGIELLLPPHANPAIANSDSSSGEAKRESERLRQIAKDGTLKRRYPTVEDGQYFMTSVCFEKRSELLHIAQEATDVIGNEWGKISEEPVTIVLFGSVAKGLTKGINHEDPSNIDLAVIGNITPDQSSALFDSIRPYREKVQKQILSTSGGIDGNEKNRANLGVCIQDVSKLSNGHFSGIACYLGSGAFPLRDDAMIWQRIESEALTKFADEERSKKQKSHYVQSREWRNAERQAVQVSRKMIAERECRVPGTVIYQQEGLF